MKKYKLNNGITLIFEKRPTKSVAVEVTVKTGSNNETKGVHGISHFIEHMLFEGTNKRESSKEISTEIESLGGEINAYTSSERTAFFIKILNKHFNKALDILSDIIINPTFKEKFIEKERKVILKEIDMVTDEPRFHQWVLFQKALFKKHPVKNPTYGFIEDVRNISREDIVDYYNKYYKPDNMIISVVGNVKNPKVLVEKYFGSFSGKAFKPKNNFKEPVQKKPIKKTEKKKLLNSYMVLGYKTVSRMSKESYALDIIDSILGRGQSGRLFEEIRNKRGLCYEVGVHHEAAKGYGMFTVYLNTDKTNINKAKKIILDEFEKLKTISDKDIEDAKNQIEGANALENDDNYFTADQMASWEHIKDASLFEEYILNLRKIKKKDIIFVVKKYLNKNYTLAVIEQE